MVTDEELDSVAVERRRTIDIVAFIDIDEVDPVYYDRTYYVAPQEAAKKPYTLLLEAMKETGKAAVGKIVLSSKEHLVLLRPSGDALVIELLFYPEDVAPRRTRSRRTSTARRSRRPSSTWRSSSSRACRSPSTRRVRERAQAGPDGADRAKLAGEEISVAPEPEERSPCPT